MLSKNEANAMAVAIGRDLNRLDADLFVSMVKLGKHWSFLRDQVLDDAAGDGVFIRESDVEAERQKWEEKMSTAANETEKAQAKIEDLREKLGYQANGLDRLQEMIVTRNVADAIDMLREIFPEHPFLSSAAEHMLAGIRDQGALAL